MSLKYNAVAIESDLNVAVIGLSETNLVVGKTWDPKVRMQSSTEKACVFSDGVLTHIDVGPSFNSTAHSVGENNVIVGTGTPSSKFGVFGWVEENGVVTRLDGLGGTNIMSTATNGRVHCGQANLPNRVSRAVKWENGQCVDLGTLGGPAAYASAINKKGSIVGSSRTSSSNMLMSGFIFSNGKMTALPSPTQNDRSFAYNLNENDDVVGAINGGWNAVKWEKAEKPVVLVQSQSQAFDINNNGIVVGTAGNPGYAFVHDGKTLYNLNDITDGLNGVALNVARSINSQGCIAAYGFDNRFVMKAFLLIPA